MGLRSYLQKLKNRRQYGYNKKVKFNSSSSGSFSTKSRRMPTFSLGKKKKQRANMDAQRRDIDKVVREATSKHLTRPDTGLNQKVISSPIDGIDDRQQRLYPPTQPQVVAAIRSGYYLAETTSKNVSCALSDRLRSKNPTKVWLAVVLTHKVLTDCKEVLGPVQHELLLEVATIAAKPVTTTTVNHGAAVMARMEAFNMLNQYGLEGKEAMEQVAGTGAAQLYVSVAVVEQTHTFCSGGFLLYSALCMMINNQHTTGWMPARQSSREHQRLWRHSTTCL